MDEGPLIRSTTTSKLSLEPGVMEEGKGEDGRVGVVEPASDPADLGERKPRPWTFWGEGGPEDRLKATRQDPMASLGRDAKERKTRRFRMQPSD